MAIDAAVARRESRALSSARYDFLIVGAGLFGASCAYELTRRGFRCLVLEKRPHAGGNCHTEQRDGIFVHMYGPHIFHTSDERVWRWVSQFSEFNGYRHRVEVSHAGTRYPFPLNLFTFRQLWGVTDAEQARARLADARVLLADTRSVEGWALANYGPELYELFVKGYTSKQWGKPPSELPASILRRLPIRFSWDRSYFDDTYQGIPSAGYGAIFARLLSGVELRLSTDYFEARRHFDELAERVIYTGALDRFFDYRFGALEYRSLRFEHSLLSTPDFQGLAQVNHSDAGVAYTRVVEHKHFYFGRQPHTWITKEFPAAVGPGCEPLYPVRDAANRKIFESYRALADSVEFRRYYFGGRLAEYRYYDMHQVIAAALKLVEQLATGRERQPCAAT